MVNSKPVLNLAKVVLIQGQVINKLTLNGVYNLIFLRKIICFLVFFPADLWGVKFILSVN